MKSFLYPVMALPLVVGCTSQPVVKEDPPVSVADRPAAAPVDVGIDWGWRLVGDASVRPVQVFSTNDQTYVQMRDRRSVVLLIDGKVVPFLVSWPYLIVQGVPSRIDVVADGYRAVAERVSAQNQASGQPGPGEEIRRVERVKIE